MKKIKTEEVKTEEVKTEVKEETATSVEELAKMIESPGVHVRKPQPGSTAARQLAYFASQGKVRYRYPRAPGEKAGAFETVCVNDLLITVEKGVTVSIPDDVAAIFDNSLQITDAAIQKGALKDLPSDSPLQQ